MQCVLVGNYGVGNLGDEALKDYFLDRFPQVQWTVVSAHPEGPREVPRLPCGLRSLFTPWWRTLGAMRRSRAVVFGGGSLLSDAESSYACVLWWWHALVARLLGKPVILAFQGVGPLSARLSRWYARQTIESAAFISVRDAESLACVREWSGVQPLLTADPVIATLHGHTCQPGTCRTLAVIPRANSAPALFQAVREYMDTHQDVAIQIFSLQPHSASEKRSLQILLRSWPQAGLHPVRSMQALSALLSTCAHLITDRYHGALAGIAVGIPLTIVPQRPGDKLDALRTAIASGAGKRELLQRAEEGEEKLRKFMNML
jgi:polysaccharide pyruvyl transferase WcaK-like protein